MWNLHVKSTTTKSSFPHICAIQQNAETAVILTCKNVIYFNSLPSKSTQN